jgi:hypothetical protein
MGDETFDVEEEAANREVAGVAVVARIGEKVGEVGGALLRKGLWDLHEALSPIASVVYHDEEVARLVSDVVSEEVSVCGISPPGGRAAKELPRPTLSCGGVNDWKELAVDLNDVRIDLLVRSPSKMNGNASSISLELPVVKKTHPGREV